METSINQRIKFLIDHYENAMPARFAKKIGVSASVVSNYLPEGGRQGEPSFTNLQKILAAYPQIRMEWLINGEGEPFKDSATNVPTPPGTHNNIGSSSNKIKVGGVPESSDIDYYRNRCRELEAKNDQLQDKFQAKIDELQEKIWQLMNKKE